MITDGDVGAAIAVGEVGVAETDVCVVGGVARDVIAGDADAVETTANDVAETVGDTTDDGDALLRVDVAVGAGGNGVLVCDAVAFAVVGVAICAVADGWIVAPLATSVAGVAASAWGVMPTLSATVAIRRDATARRKTAVKRYRRVQLARFFSCTTVTHVPIVIATTAPTPLLTRITSVRYGTGNDLSSKCLRSVRTAVSVVHAACGADAPCLLLVRYNGAA